MMAAITRVGPTAMVLSAQTTAESTAAQSEDETRGANLVHLEAKPAGDLVGKRGVIGRGCLGHPRLRLSVWSRLNRHSRGGASQGTGWVIG